MANELRKGPHVRMKDAPREKRVLDILVADDDPIFRSLLVSRLRLLDGEITEAIDGGEAWALVRDRVFDLAIIDFDKPGVDGCDLARCLRTHPRTRHIPVVMCTARGDTASMRAAVEAGVSSFLIKPLNWSLFETHIRHLLSMSRATHEAEQRIEDLESHTRREAERLMAASAALKHCLTQMAGTRGDSRAFDQAMMAASALLRDLSTAAEPDASSCHQDEVRAKAS